MAKKMRYLSLMGGLCFVLLLCRCERRPISRTETTVARRFEPKWLAWYSSRLYYGRQSSAGLTISTILLATEGQISELALLRSSLRIEKGRRVLSERRQLDCIYIAVLSSLWVYWVNK